MAYTKMHGSVKAGGVGKNPGNMSAVVKVAKAGGSRKK